MSNKPLAIYHANCADGFCAAWIAHRAFDGNAEFVAAKYGDEPPCVEGRNVYVLDFSYPREMLLKMHASAASILVLDHHKTAQKELEGLPFCIFDMAKSGARLTWEHFFPNEPSPWLVDYTEDRDLWRWKLPDSKEVNAALRSYPLEFDIWDAFGRAGNSALESLKDEGAAILRAQQQLVDQHVANAGTMELDGYTVPCVNCTTLISEIVGELAEGKPFAVGFFISANGDKIYSLRSRQDGVDVSEIAKRHGGGGHKNAAGFTVKA